MVDFIKVEAVISEDLDLTAHPLLYSKFETVVRNDSGVIVRAEATYNSMTFKLRGSRLFVQGSLHKYYNHLVNRKAPNQTNQFQISKGYNGNDFNYYQLVRSINHLCETFKIDVKRSKILNLEFGLNLIHTLETNKVLNGLMIHRGAMFNKPLQNTFRRCFHEHYSIKCYDKALQYGEDFECLRIELNYNKMKSINRLGIIYLDDLKEQNKLISMKHLLIEKWNEIVLYDYTIKVGELTVIDKMRSLNYKNEVYWNELCSNRLDRPKKHLQRIIENHSLQIQSFFTRLLEVKWNELNSSCVRIPHSNTLGKILHLPISDNTYSLVI